MTQDLHRNYIAGEWTAGADAIRNLNPSDLDDVVGEYAQATPEQTRAALDAAAHAQKTWRYGNPQLRADALDRIGTELLARKDELGRLLAREEGKTLPEGVAEVMRAGQIFKFYGGEALRIPGEHVTSIRDGLGIDVVREPVGVVGLITPWNFPIAIPSWKIAPALCYGNSVVFKPAELVPGSAWALAEIISRAGLPPGVFNLVMGSGRQVGAAIADSPHIAALGFTGSTATGLGIAQKVITRGVKLQLEMGGKNPLVVLDDANLTQAVEVALNSAYFSTGQRCTAASRFIVTRGIHDRFVEALLERLAGLTVGHALEPTTRMGPVVDERQLQQDLNYIALGQEEGARRVFGGELLQRPTRGHYLSPTLFVDGKPGMRLNQEEVFGPVACVLPVADYDEALAVANGVEQGLSSGICTTSLKYATDFQRRSEAGMVMVNVPTAGVDYHVPFGGRKASSYGPREQGRAAVEFYTTTKTAYVLA
jgi:alpha-ketoglutaric semialdehyde dehydrogenase